MERAQRAPGSAPHGSAELQTRTENASGLISARSQEFPQRGPAVGKSGVGTSSGSQRCEQEEAEPAVMTGSAYGIATTYPA